MQPGGPDMISTKTARIQTNGNCDIIDITNQVAQAINESGSNAGTITVFVAHSTCGITTVEYEPGLISDLQDLFGRIAPQNIPPAAIISSENPQLAIDSSHGMVISW